MMHDEETPAHRHFELPGATLQYGPDKTVDVEHIALHVRPDLETQTLQGSCETFVRVLDEPVRDLRLDAVDLQVSRAVAADRAVTYVSRGKHVDLQFEPPLKPGERVSFTLDYRVERPRHGLFFVEPTAAYPRKVRHCWTQSQDQNARYWFPCLDYPHEKQTSSTTVVVPKGLFALANGVLAKREERGKEISFTYEQTVPHATYLMSFVVGPFEERQQRSGEKPIFYYVLPGRAADGERSFGKTPAMMDVFDRRIGTPYPYGRYSQIAVSDFIFGGMENTSATTQTDRTLHDERAHIDFSSDPLVAHELAHQWFGDLLTCRDWSHAWLNEGFATFFEAVYREADLGYDEYLYDIFGCVARYLEEDRSRYRRAIVHNRFRDPIELFDRHLYEKGAAVLHMLRGDLGEERFWRSIARYVTDNARRSVETIDLIRAIEMATGRNLRGFFDQWVFGSGHPQAEVSLTYDRKRGALKVAVAQKHAAKSATPFRFDVEIGLCDQAPSLHANAGAGLLPGERRVRMQIETAAETMFVPLESEPKLVRFDPGAFVLADLTYAFGTDYAVAALRSDPTVVARIRAARELARDGSAAARGALEQALESDPFWGVQAEIATALGSTHAPWAQQFLCRQIAHPHAKVRRAIAAALGRFRAGSVVDALLAPARDDASYFVQSTALHALGKTRDARAFDVLRAALQGSSWNGVVESGAARGLGELADARALPLLREATQPGKEEALRRAAIEAIARAGEVHQESRTAAVDAISSCLDDEVFLVQLAAIGAAEELGDARLLPMLDRLSSSAFDGRIRRDAAEAAIRIREAARVPAQVDTLRSEMDALREDHRKLQEKIEELSPPS